MEKGKQFLALLIFLQFYQGLMAAMSIQTTPEYAVVNPGENVTFICRVLRDGAVSYDKLDVCTWHMDGQTYYLNQDSPPGSITYGGAGLDRGECGISINNVKEKMNGNISCSVKVSNNILGYDGRMSLIVAIAPQKPKLEVTVASDGKKAYKERDTLTATCVVRDGRPVANISWYLGDELIYDGLKMPVETCPLEKKELCTIQQNLTRTLQASDDKKVLKCVASHPSFKGGDLIDQYTIYVNYPPKPAARPFDFFGLVEGAIGKVSITVEANPQPIISWSIDGDSIYEGTNNGRYTVEPTLLKGPGEYESVLLIDTLTKEDTNKEYKVIAHNEAGETQYLVSISTSPEPKVLEMGAGLIIIIVVAILLILLVLGGVFYTRAKGMLCFAGSDSRRTAGESSDTESADHTSDQKPKLKLVSVFKKKSDKIPADKEMLKNVTSDEDKSDQPPDTNDKGESVVYAELDLASGPAVVVRVDDDKTEYAEIIHTQPPSK